MDLDAVEGGYEQYMHLRVNNIVKTFDDEGVMTTTNNYYPLQRCSEESFRTEYEIDYYSLKKSRS